LFVVAREMWSVAPHTQGFLSAAGMMIFTASMLSPSLLLETALPSIIFASPVD
jgi:hypothetical protein